METGKVTGELTMSAGQNVLIIGAGGYLGSVITPMLLEEGYRVIAFDKFYFGRETLAAVADHPHLRIVVGDVRRFDPSLLEGIHSVLYMAALSNDPSCELDPAWTTAVNRDAAIHIAELSREHGVQRFLFASSCSVYGAGGDTLLTEQSEVNPVSTYAKSKIEAEQRILALSSPTFHTVALRKATLFGTSPRMRFDLAVNVMTLHGVKRKELYVTGGGEQWRPFLHVRDAARAYRTCLSAPVELISGQVFNVAAQSLKIRELAEVVARRTNAEVHVVPDDSDKRDYRVSAKRIEQTLGFQPEYDIEFGIDSIAAALRDGELKNTEDARYYTLRTLKRVLETPAIQGGESVRQTFLPFALPQLGKEEEDEVVDTLRSGWITTGPKTKRFEDMCRDYLGSKHAIAFNSCTGSLHVAVAAAGIGPGDEVITTPISWPATASVVIHQGGKPVFVDVEPDTLNMDASKIEAAITPRTKAIIPVHMAGQPCDLERIGWIAHRYNLVVIEDAAHAIGAEYHGRKIGSISLATAFSFYPIKNMTTIEGGVLATDDDGFAENARIIGNHGISRDAWKRYSSQGELHWQLLRPGFKYNMTDIQASVGLHQLPRLEGFLRTREEYAALYDAAFQDLPIRPLARRPNVKHAHHLYIVLLELERLGISRDEFLLALKAENIGTGVHFISLHLQPYYQDVHHMQPQDLPVAYDVSQRLLSLPLYPKMTLVEVNQVIQAVRKIAAAYALQPEEAAMAAGVGK
jgi:dTDP-4-amino-4,6-dideoxygalactose transaminase/nucleoside-diphosphate-sugar epimerase